jgi:hypothetical protein
MLNNMRKEGTKRRRKKARYKNEGTKKGRFIQRNKGRE